MRILRSAGLFCALLLASLSAFGKLILVNTTNNISPGPGQTNLVQAIGLLEDGDTIGFNIPGPGPFYLETPSFEPDNGYPPITNHNVTIDGYTQPGSTPNTNTILSSNNARIQIVIDARGGGYHSEEVTQAFDLRESEQLMIKGTNVTIRGLCFLGPGTGNKNTLDPSRYAVAFTPGAHGGHICGCWFGVDLDRTNVFRFADAVAAFKDNTDYVNGTVIGVASNTVTGSDARAQFNVIVGEFIPVVMEGERYRISGNFFNVLPDGMTDFKVEATNNLDSFIEIGRLGNHVIIGTDGDGVNDAEERNIFGGVTNAVGDQLLQWYSGSRTNIIIAGNYFGLATDGVTRFANSFRLLASLGNMSTVRIGSDFDGVSDYLEANVIAMNYPFDQIFPSPAPTNVLPAFGDLPIGCRLSFRGNQLLGNNTCPLTWANGSNTLLMRLTNYCGRFMDTNGGNGVIPVLLTNSSQGRLRGSCALGTGLYTNIIIDLYAADNEGWTNGKKFAFRELEYLNPVDLTTNYYGFAQGRVYLGSFVENGPQDLNPAPGRFEFDIHNLALDTNTLLTVSASYSADPPGTHNGRTHTSVFAMPITLLPAPTLTVVGSQTGPRLFWPTNSGLYRIQSTPGLAPLNWSDLAPQPQITIMGSSYSANLTASNTSRFYRLAR
jgi:hypothetical protein